MKRPSPTGQTHLVFAPVAFLRRLAALVPPPRANLVRYFGVFAPKARVRPRVVPALPPPVGEPSVGQSREPLERQGPPGAVVAHPLEARDVVLVEPGVGMEGEALNEGTAAPPPASGRTGPAPGHWDAFELQDVERSVRRCLLLQHAARTEQREGTTGHGGGERLHLGVGGTRQRVQAQLGFVHHLLEDGLPRRLLEVALHLFRSPRRPLLEGGEFYTLFPAARRISSFDGRLGSNTFLAVSTPATGSLAGSMSPS